MKNGQVILLKRMVALLLSLVMIVSLCGCGKKANEPDTAPTTKPENKEPQFQAYYEPLTSEDIAIEGEVYYVSSQLLLTSVADASYEDIADLVQEDGGEIIGYISATGDYQIRYHDAQSFEELEQLVENLKNNALVEDACLAYAAQLGSEAVNYINDPWTATDDPSDTSGSVWDEDNPAGKNWWAEAIDMPSVWGMDLSTQTVKVGIMDSMFDITNEDLDQNIFAKTWNNPENKDGSCRVAQIYTDAVADYEQAVANRDEEAQEAASNRVSSVAHGTHVAGIIAAQADNAFGITGINQNVKLYGYALLSEEAAASEENQWSTIFQYKCALAHLLNEGVKVINISMGFNAALMGTQDGDPYWATFTSVNSKVLEDFLLKYIEAGYEFLIVKSAGNDSSMNKKYDAANDMFGAISDSRVAQRIFVVGATKYNTKYDYYPIAEFSNTGSRVNVYAPGVDVLSDIPSNGVCVMSGTSMAAPIVTGLASLIWGINPQLSAEQVTSFIRASTSATMFDLDDESIIIRDLINWLADPTAIVNAKICVQLAQATVGDGSKPGAEYGTVSGMICAVTLDKAEFVDINIESISLYNQNGDLVSTVPLQDIAYYVTEDDTEHSPILKLHTFSVLVEPGAYVLKVEADGYDAQSREITVNPNDVISVDFEFVSQQNNPNQQLVSAAEYWEGRKTAEYQFSYNTLGQLVNLVAYRYEYGEAVKWYTQKYEYDGNGNLILIEHGSSQSYRYQYEYDGNGRVIRYTYAEYYDGSLGPSESYTLSYDGQGRIVERRSESGSSVETYSYDESANKVYAEGERYWGDGHFVETEEYDLRYAPLVFRTYNSRSEGYGNASGMSIAFMPTWNLIVASTTIDDTCSFIEDSSGYLLRVVDADGNDVYVCNYDEASTDASDVAYWYKQTLQTHPETTKHSYTSGGQKREYYNDTEYMLYDIDKDGTPELIVKEDQSNYYVYTMGDSGTTFCGKFYGDYPDCLYSYDGNGLVVYGGGTGSLHLEYLWLYTLTNGVLENSDMICTTEEVTYEELMDCLEKYTNISNFIPITDDSLLDNL